MLNERFKGQCNCENSECEKLGDHVAGDCPRPAGEKKCIYVGPLCDICASRLPKEYLKETDMRTGARGDGVNVRTPWGKSDESVYVAEGIRFYYTPSHGGYGVSIRKAEQMPKPLRKLGELFAGKLWFEEDVDWAAVVAAFPDLFSEEDQKKAIRTLRHWHTDEYEEWAGEEVPEEESHVKSDRAFGTKHANDWVAISAFGDWAEGVPKGMVGVLATKGGSRKPGAEKAWFLVPKEEYDTRQSQGFVIDPSKHEQSATEFGLQRRGTVTKEHRMLNEAKKTRFEVMFDDEAREKEPAWFIWDNELESIVDIFPTEERAKAVAVELAEKLKPTDEDTPYPTLINQNTGVEKEGEVIEERRMVRRLF